MTDEQQLIWAAGYFDGEGCVVYEVEPIRGHTQYNLRIGGSNKEALELLQELFGGSVVEMSEKYKVNLKQYVWYTATSSALYTAQRLAEYSIVKRKELELFIEAVSLQSRLGKGISHESRALEINRRLHYHNKLKELRSYQKRDLGHTGLAYVEGSNLIQYEEQDESPSLITPTDPEPKPSPFRWIK